MYDVSTFITHSYRMFVSETIHIHLVYVIVQLCLILHDE